MHMWTDYLYYEIVDPKSGKTVKPGGAGELVITTLRKEGAPLIRYRTHDLTKEVAGACPCGLSYPRIDTLLGRSDDMVKVKGSIIYPSRVDEFLATVDGVSSEYQIMIDHLNGKDTVTLFFETEVEPDGRESLAHTVKDSFKAAIGITVNAKAVGMGDLPRSEKKSTRIFDNRY
jgi:phenylacetate-CoA ligase